MSLVPGLKGSASVRVIHENTAAVVGSGSLEVFATPMMIALMENAALNTVKPFLAEGEATVGTEISVTHDAPTPIGETVTAEAELIAVDRRKLQFQVQARVGDEIIGKGTHTRFIINEERFLQKALAKKQQ
ncbi:MAG: thioesterase family protein [Oscillospiraceae bacterium]|nr:thioesterase family protein [Oscillospiraceae bacterium]MBR2808311.1 thioesterase family protein [Oscillospiraceae bacterium]MBR4551495.1 thioesterase family protein [Oscillospiraceae bacterium]